MISKRDHLYLAALLRDHLEYAERSPARHLLWLSLREGLIALLEDDNHFDRQRFIMLSELVIRDGDGEPTTHLDDRPAFLR